MTGALVVGLALKRIIEAEPAAPEPAIAGVEG